MEDPQPLFDPSRPPFGHALFTDALVSAIEGGRVAHGWLLTGPQGVGKSAMACMAAAWMLRETEGQTSFVETTGMVVDPDDPGSNLVCKGHHPDLLVIRPEIKDNKSGQIKLDQISQTRRLSRAQARARGLACCHHRFHGPGKPQRRERIAETSGGAAGTHPAVPDCVKARTLAANRPVQMPCCQDTGTGWRELQDHRCQRHAGGTGGQDL